MKKVHFLIAVVLASFSIGNLSAQNIDPNLYNETTMTKQEARKAAKAAHKAAMKAENEQLYNNALEAHGL